MIPWMLGRLEENPFAVFPEKELRQRFPEEFRTAVRERLVRRAALPPGPGCAGSYVHPSGRTFMVVAVPGSGYEAFDDEEPEQDCITLSPADLVQWTLDMSGLARRFQEANGLIGTPECIEPRLWFLGEKEAEKGLVAYLLAFLNGTSSVEALLGALSMYLPAKYRRFAVACPTFAPSLDATRQLESAGVCFFRLDPEDPLILPDTRGPERLEAGPVTQPDFQYSGDFRWVDRRGHEFNLSPHQADVVRILHHAHQEGTLGLPWEAIQRRLSGNASRMSDIFKKRDPRSQLISYQKQGRLYRLNYY